LAARSFVWLATGGGAWAIASNWDDVTDNTDPSQIVPGPADNVSVAGPAGNGVQTISGPGAAASAAFSGNSLLSGSFSFGAVTLGAGGNGGLLQIGSGSALQAGSATFGSGSVLAGAGGTLSVAGTLQLGAPGSGATLDATGGGVVTSLSLRLNAGGDSIYVDPDSIVDIGGARTGLAGQLTVDAGATLAGRGNADGFGAVANAGTIAAAGGMLTVGALSGSGLLSIGAGATLALNGVCGAGQAVAFAGADATLALDEEAYAPAGTLTGFAPGDAIDVVGSQITEAGFTPSGSGGGVLTLFYGSQVAARLTLAGSYTGSLFATAGDGDGGTLITVAPATGGGGPPSPGTVTPDQYAWIAAASGNWNSAANWQDQTSGQDPAAIAPGANDLVTIAAPQSGFWVIAGPANAAALSLTGEVALSGAYGIGSLAVGSADAGGFTDATLDLVSGATLGAASAAIAAGGIVVSGSTSLLSVAGSLSLGGGAAGVGLPVTSLTAGSGGGVRAASLVLGGGSGDSLTTDASGWIEIGDAGGAAAGAVTVDPGAMLSGNGSVNPLGATIDNGTILASGGTLTLGSVSGTGGLAIGAGATLELLGASSPAITVQGAGGTLAFGGARDAPSGVISGFAPGDLLHFEGSPLTSVTYAQSTGVLSLIYGTTTVARLTLTGIPMLGRFVLTPDGAGGAEIGLTVATGGGGGGGQTGTDALAWAAPVSGNWSLATNWDDLTTGMVATAPPGSETPAQVAGPTGAAFQAITGTGTSASLTFTGNTSLTGSFSTAQVQAGAPGITPVAAELVLAPGTTLSAQSGLVAAGDVLATGVATLLGVSGVLTVGSADADALLAAQGHGAIGLGSLVLAGGSVTVDSTASLEIGTLGDAVAGSLAIDPGFAATGAGALDVAGTILDNGLIDAEGGTLAVGSVSGAGSLSIGTEATLSLAAGDSCPIGFTGGGATLILPGTAQGLAATIAGFAPGDAILIAGSPVDGVAYVPGAGGIGTLTLSYGGVAAEQLLLAGTYAGGNFAVQPDGSGAEITVAAGNGSGPPQGTVGADLYAWTGADSDAWDDPGNWTDVTQGQSPASVAPGQNDLVGIAGPDGGVLLVQGPADAASLSLSGTVELAGAYAIGTLAVGGSAAASLALGSGAVVDAASAVVAGGITTDGGDLAVSGALTLGTAGLAGVLAAGGPSAIVIEGDAFLATAGSAVAASAGASVEVGGDDGAAAGSVTVDAGGLLQGQGAVNAAGQTIDDGTIAASAGTLVLGDVSGMGTLLVGIGAELVLAGSIGGSLVADFAAGGTLTLAAAPSGDPALLAPAIAGFGPGDEILLPEGGITTASYALTAPGEGVLSLFDGGLLVAELTLLGSQTGLSFDVTAENGGGSILTATPAMTAGQGGMTMTTPIETGPITRGDLLAEFLADFPFVSQTELGDLIGSYTVYQYVSPDGSPPADTPYGGAGEPLGHDIEIVAPLLVGPGETYNGAPLAIQPGYSAIIAEGTENIGLTDRPDTTQPALGNVLIVGNYGSDALAALGNNDTLVGAPGANTTFYAKLAAGAATGTAINVYIQGGGNDLIATNTDNAAITTSGGSSRVFLGPSSNDVISNGSDFIFGTEAGIGSDTVVSQADPGQPGDIVFSPGDGYLQFIGGADPSTVVGTGGQISMDGGAGDGSLLWAGSSPYVYIGGAGSAVIVGGSASAGSVVQGGAGPVIVYGGTGPGIYSGGAGSIFVLGAGASTVTAAAGNLVYITGDAPVSVNGSGAGVDVYAGPSIADNVFQAGTGNETLWGGAGNDLFIGGNGTDILTSDGGDDVFSFTSGVAAGTDYVVGFVPGQSIIALHGYGSQTPAVTYAFGDAFVNLPGLQIVLENVASLPASSFTLS
jgi:hypothetical protein